MDGKCKVINKSDGYIVTILKRGDVVGESEFLQIPVRYIYYRLPYLRVMISMATLLQERVELTA